MAAADDEGERSISMQKGRQNFPAALLSVITFVDPRHAHRLGTSESPGDSLGAAATHAKQPEAGTTEERPDQHAGGLGDAAL
mgnify:CR=1 FL=1